MNWKKLVLWMPALLVLLIVALMAVTILLINTSPRTRQAVLAEASRRISQSMGRQFVARDFRLRLTDLGLELFDIVVREPEAKSAPAFLQIHHLTVDLRFASAFRPGLRVKKLLIYEPVLHIRIDSSTGRVLVPAKPDWRSGVGSVFDLAVEDCLIEGGVVYVNDASTQLTAGLHNLQLRTEFDPKRASYHGLLRYNPGEALYGDHPPIPHALQTKFVMSLEDITFEEIAVSSGQSRINARGSVEDFGRPRATGAYEAQLSADDLARIFKRDLVTAGVVQVTGSFGYGGQANGRLRSAFLSGRLSSPGLTLRLPSGPTEVRELRAAYKLANGKLQVQDFAAQALGGSLRANLVVDDVGGASHSSLKAQLHEISLEQLQPVTQQFWGPQAGLGGRVSADADATWNRDLANLAVQTNVSLQGAIGQRSLTGGLHGRYIAGRQMELRDSYVRTPETSLKMNGKVGSHSQLEVALHTDDLHELEVLAGSVASSFTGKPSRKLGLYGSGSLTGTVTGFVMTPRFEGKLELRNPQVAGTSWKILRSDIALDSSEFRLRHAAIESMKGGKASVDLYTGLDHWTYSSAKPIHLEMSASQFAVADLLRIANLPSPLSGALSGKASVTGSGLHPLGQGEFSLANGRIFSEPIESLSLAFQADERNVKSTVLVRLPAGVFRAECNLDPQTSTFQGNIESNNIRLEQLAAVQESKLPVRGTLSLSASGRGVIASPEAKATLRLSDLQFEDQSIADLTLEAGIHNGFGKMLLHSSSAQRPLTGQGSVEMKAPYLTDIQFDAPHFSLAPLLAIYAPLHSGIRAETGIHASLRGALQSAKQLEGHVNMEGLTVSYREFRVDAAKPIRVSYRNGTLVLEPASLEGTGIDLQARATVPLGDLEKTEYLLHGTIDLRVAQVIQPDLTCTGQMQFDLDSRRHAAVPNSYGEVRVVNAGLYTPAFPLGLDQVNGLLTVGQKRVEIRSFEGQSGGGTVNLRGGFTFRPSLQVDVALTAKNVRLRYLEGARAIVDSNLTLVGDTQEAKLSGNVEVQRLSLAPDFNLDNLVRRLNEQELAVPPSELARHVRIEVGIESASEIDLVSPRLSLRGNANLRVAGTLAEPVILGRANLLDGDLFLGGNRYVMQNGAIDFVNPLRTEPLFNVRAQTKIHQYLIHLNVEGPADRLNITFTSEPPLPSLDIIQLLAFGNTSTTDASTGNPLATGAMGAQSALVQSLGSAVSSRIQRFVGLSYFSVNPALGSSDQNTGARVIVQHRVTSNLVVTYSADVTSTQDQALQLEYRFNQRWSVSGVRDQNGGFGATLSFHRIF